MIILLAYCAVQVKNIFFLDEPRMLVVTGTIWVVASGAIPRQSGSISTQKMLKVYLVRLCLALSALCYIWARVTEAPREMWSPPYTAADGFAITAMLLIGSALRVEFVRKMRALVRGLFAVYHRVQHLGWISLRRGDLRNCPPDIVDTETARQKIGARHVR
jgi:hypothetical protein